MGADPFTIMAIASAASSVAGGFAADSAGKANRDMHNYNATVLRLNKESELQRAKYEADLLRDKGKEFIARNRVAISKSGVEVAGSPLEAIGENATAIEFDALMKAYEGELKAWELEGQAAQQEYMGQIAAWRGKQQKRSAMISAGTSLIGAAWGGITTPGNVATALRYGTNVGSTQTNMLAAQDAGLFWIR